MLKDLGPLKSKYLTELRAALQIGLKIIARLNNLRILDQLSIGKLNLKLSYYANRQNFLKKYRLAI